MESSNKHLQLGKEIFIQVVNNNTIEMYKSRVLRILQADEFIISGPIINHTPLLFNKGDRIIVQYYMADDGRYTFRAKVLDQKTRRSSQIKIVKKSEIQRIQERDFYRLKITLDVTKKHLLNEETVQENCILHDISASGMRFLSNFQHEIDDIISLSLKLDKRNISLKGRIVRIQEIDDTYYSYSIGVRFFSLSSKTKDEIVKFIFNEQRKYRKKGLI